MRSPSLGYDYRGRTRAFGAADDGAEIMRILYAIQQDQKGLGRDFRKKLYLVRVAGRGRHGQHALMVRLPAHSIQPGSRLTANRDVEPASRFNHLAKAFVTCAVGYDDSLDPTAPGAQSLKDGKNSIDVRHCSVVIQRRR